MKPAAIAPADRSATPDTQAEIPAPSGEDLVPSDLMTDPSTMDAAETLGEALSPSGLCLTGMPTSEMLSIVFGRNGNARAYQGDGWSAPEGDYTFTVGPTATMAIPVQACENGMLLELRLHPFAYREVLPFQRLCLRVNGVPIGSTVVRQRTTVAFLIPIPVVAGTLELQIEMPNAARPSDILASQDHRRLGVAMYGLRLYRFLSPLQGPRFATVRTILNRDAGLQGGMEELEAQIGMPADRLVTEFESLGDNCEFGLLQRKCGAEPLGLFRFSSVPLSPLLRGLENGFEGLGDAENIMPRLEDKPLEWMIHERRYMLRYHSGKREHEATEEEMRGREEKKLKFLRRKMLDDLASPAKIFVYKRHQALLFEEVLPLFRALNTYGPACLLWVVPATGTYLPGTVEVILPGLYRGHIDRIPPHHWPGQLSVLGWLEVCASAYLLSQGSARIADRHFLASEVWHPAGNGELSHILMGGWSSPDSQGVWGVGKAHQIRLATDAGAGQPVAVDIEVQAYVWDDVNGRQIDVFVNGRWHCRLDFTKAQDSASVSLETLSAADETGLLTIEFRHRTLPAKPAGQDTRLLGLALHRIRVRSLAPS